jgi:hypothetical protein
VALAEPSTVTVVTQVEPSIVAIVSEARYYSFPRFVLLWYLIARINNSYFLLDRKKNLPKERKRKGNKDVAVVPLAEPSNTAQAMYMYLLMCH